MKIINDEKLGKGKQFRKGITAVLTKRDLANPFQ